MQVRPVRQATQALPVQEVRVHLVQEVQAVHAVDLWGQVQVVRLAQLGLRVRQVRPALLEQVGREQAERDQAPVVQAVVERAAQEAPAAGDQEEQAEAPVGTDYEFH